MRSWQYDEGDVLRIQRKGQEVLARVASYEDQLDDSLPLLVNLRISDGKRWGERQVKVYKRDILGAIPDWYEKQQAEWEAELKEFADKQWAKMTDAEKRQTHEFAVKHGFAAQERRSPLDILIDRATGRE